MFEQGQNGNGYTIHRWWAWNTQHCGVPLAGSYFLIAKNLPFAYMQGAESGHVPCIVDDFGNLVRRYA